MRIAVMGAGALGGYFGGRLAQAGYDTHLIARGATLAALRAEGLRIESPRGDLHLTHINVTDDPADVGPVDLVLFLVKTYDLQDAAAALAPMLGPKTMVATFQNGVSAPEFLGDIIGHHRVIAGVARVPASLIAPGYIRHSGGAEIMVFGEPGGGSSERCERFAEVLQTAGAQPEVSANIQYALWEKMVQQVALSSITSLTGLTLGSIRDVPETAAMFQAAMAETEAVGRAVVPDIPAGIAARLWEFLSVQPASVGTSMQNDMKRGRRLELRALSGDIVRLGKMHGVPTPVNAVLYAALLPFVDGAVN